MKKNLKKAKYPVVILIHVILCLPAIIDIFFGWWLLNTYTAFTVAPIMIVGFLLLFVAFISSLIFLLIDYTNNRNFLSAIPFLLVATIVIFKLSGFSTISQTNLNFNRNYKARTEVIKMIESGELKTITDDHTGHGRAQLPKKYTYLSEGGGDIFLEKNNTIIGFYFYRGILDDYVAFVYKKDSKQLTAQELKESSRDIRKLRAHWYLVSP